MFLTLSKCTCTSNNEKGSNWDGFLLSLCDNNSNAWSWMFQLCRGRRKFDLIFELFVVVVIIVAAFCRRYFTILGL